MGPSEPVGADERRHEIDEEARGNRKAQNGFEHRWLSSAAPEGRHEGGEGREASEAENEIGKIGHLPLLNGMAEGSPEAA
jgi:hypothetical protein